MAVRIKCQVVFMAGFLYLELLQHIGIVCLCHTLQAVAIDALVAKLCKGCIESSGKECRQEYYSFHGVEIKVINDGWTLFHNRSQR